MQLDIIGIIGNFRDVLSSNSLSTVLKNPSLAQQNLKWTSI